MALEDVSTMSYTQVASRARVIHARLATMAAKHRLSASDQTEADDLTREVTALDNHRRQLERSADIVGGRGGGGIRIEGEADRAELYGARDTTGGPLGGLRSKAMHQLDRSVKAGLPAEAAAAVEPLIDTGPTTERSWAARWVTETGSPDYRSAFAKVLCHGEQRAALEFTAAESDAFRRVAALQTEQRSMGDSPGTAGGYLVPFELDPSVILTSSGSNNPLMQISRVINSVSDVWHGISSQGVTAEWLGEAVEASDGSPTLAEPAIPANKMSVFVPYSVELEGDAPALLTELGRLLQDGATQLLNTALTTGSGLGQPRGIITALAGSSSQVNTATPDTLVSGDVYATQNALAPRFSANAQWCAHLAISNAMRQMVTGSIFTFPELRDTPPTLLNRKVNELSNMASVLTVGQPNNILLYGDFSNFVVTSRVGSRVEPIPHLVGANRRPTGQRGVWLWGRYGSDCVNINAFRLLSAD